MQQVFRLIPTLLLLCLLALQTTNVLAIDWNTGLARSEQSFLAALKYEWNSMDEDEQKRWKALAHQYENSPPEKQVVMRERVRRWAALSPAQRQSARENYKALRDRERGERNSSWNSYQHLDDAERNEYKKAEKQSRQKQSKNPNVPQGAAAYTR